MKIKLITTVSLIVILGALLSAGGSARQAEDPGVLLRAAIEKEEVEGQLEKAIEIYQTIVKQFPGNREIAAKAQLHIGLCYEKLGLKEAVKAFQKVVENYPEQAEAVKVAREKLEILSRAQAIIEKGEKEFRIRQVWPDAIDYYFTGAPSPDGRYLTYVNWENGNLGVRNLEKGENRLLTKDASWNTGEMANMSIFSPDGRQVAYTWNNKENVGELRIIGMDGSAPRVLYANKEAGWASPASWSNDGKQILTFFTIQGISTKIAFVSTEDGSVKDVKSLAPCPLTRLRMSLSPDGQYIAYSFPQQQDTRNRDIFLLAADGSRQIPLVEHPADDLVQGWAPDGKGVIFRSDRTGSMGIWIIHVADGKAKGEPELIRANMGNLRPLGLTRDGSLYYGLYSGWSDIYVVSIDPETGKVLAPPTKAVQKYEGFNSAPSWSPDGQELVCRSSYEGVEEDLLLIRSFRTGEIQELVPKHVGGLNFHYIRWSPDGRSILAIGPDEKGKWWFLFAINVQTGDAEIIAQSDSNKGEALFSPEWAPDGKVVYFMRSSKEFRRLIRHEIETGMEKELLRFPQSLDRHLIVLSPDGRQIAFTAGNAVKLLSTAGGEPRELIQVKDIRTIAWARDGQYILYGKTREGTQDMVDLWRVPVKGGEPQKLDLAMSLLMHLRAHPDGRRIAFTAKTQNEKSEVWVMENFLPEEKSKKK